MKTPTMMEQATQAFDHTREYANDRVEQAKTFVHEKPFLTALLGLGAGFMIGLLLRPSHRK